MKTPNLTPEEVRTVQELQNFIDKASQDHGDDKTLTITAAAVAGHLYYLETPLEDFLSQLREQYGRYAAASGD